MKKNPNNQSGLFNARVLVAVSLLLCAFGMTLVAVTPASKAAASPATSLPDPCDYLSANACTALHQYQALVASIREQMKGGFVSKTQAILTADESTLPAVALNDPSPEALQAVNTLPLPLQAPVAGLYSAVQQARDLLGGSLPADQVAQARVALESFREEAATEMEKCVSSKESAETCRSHLPATPVFPATLQHAADESRAAALLVAMALDKYLPALQAAASQLPSKAGQSVAGCDLLDQTPNLCVGSNGNNTYTADEMLLIDLGGDDTYQNSAGGAPSADLNNPADVIPISINLDLGGNDVYTSHGTIVQGAGLFGVGELVKLNGNAQFEASGPVAWVQGMGASGVGFIFVEGGDHTFTAGAIGSPAPSAQGFGVLGIGAIVSIGGGSDTYTVQGDATGTNVNAQASTLNGVGLLFDDGGADTFQVTLSGSAPNALSLLGWKIAQVEVQASSAAYGPSEALIIEGPGSHSYSIDVNGTGIGYWWIFGQAVAKGLANNIAVLDDAGGPNTYLIKVRQQSDDLEIPIDDSCGCTQAVATTGEYPQIGYYVFGQASQPFGAVTLSAPIQQGAALIDEAGDASFSIDGQNAFSIHLADHLTHPAAAPYLTLMGSQQGTFGPAFLDLSGQGDTSWSGGNAILLTTTGKHSYSISGHQGLEALATSDHAVGTPVAIAIGAPPYISGQGADTLSYTGDGALLDLAGEGARIEASQTVDVHTAPTSWGAIQAADPHIYINVQGEVGTLVALGPDPHIVVHPAEPDPRFGQSQGHHGYGVWGEAGFAPLATGAAPLLEVTLAPSSVNAGDDSWPYWPISSTPTEGIPRIPVAARLTDSSGAPIAGATLHFIFEGTQSSGGILIPENVCSVWQMDEVTDLSGSANALLPVWGAGYLSGQSCRGGSGPSKFQVTVVYDGGDGLYPQSATQSLPLNTLVRAVSRKTHGSAGTFDVDLTNGDGIEPRSGGSNGDYTLVLTFANPLTTVGGATVASGSGSINSSNVDPNDAHNYVVNLTGVPNAQRITVNLNNVTDSAGNATSGVPVSMAALVGDVNGNGVVSNTDVAALKSQVAATIDASNFRNDVNANGVISNTDVSTAKAQVGTTLP